MNATAALPIVGVDLAKSVFQLAVADGSWRVVESHRLTRTQFERWFANRAVGLVVMEACGSAHHWARWLNGLGIEVRLLPAAYVRAYVKRNKTDAADACALLEAARCADIVPVRVKSIEQQALQGLHRTRSLWMGTRTSRINALRGFCREFGIVIAQGARLGVEQIGRVLADPHSAVPDADPRHDEAAGRGDPAARGAHRATRTRVHRAGPRTRPRAPRCCRFPASACSPPPRWWQPPAARSATFAMRGTSPPGSASRPKEHSSGSTRHLGRISKRGDRYLRMLLTHGARSVLRAASAAVQAGKSVDGLRHGRSPCRAAPITTRRPARSPTSWRASATRRCATPNRTAQSRLNKKIARTAFALPA